jgi:2-dehydropantoate 2-reductase
VALGELDNRSSERVERLRAAFERAGVWVEVPGDIQAAIWTKFLFIAAISGVAAVTRAPLGVVRKLPETRRMLETAMQEIYAVAAARGIRLADGIVAQTLAYIDTLPEKTTPSMQRDLLEGKPAELNAQNGAVVRLGQEAGIPTPLHTFLYSSLLPVELRARGEVDGYDAGGK